MKIVVNLITALRIVFTVVLPIMKNKVSIWAFIIDITLLFLTDFLDGVLARKFRVQTLFGSLLDTVADKALSIMLLIMLIDKIEILLVILILECIIAVINMITVGLRKRTRSSMLGKIKTWIISITIIFGYMYDFGFISDRFVFILSFATIVMQIFVAIGYIKTLIVSKEIKYEKDDNIVKSDIRKILFDTDYYIEHFNKN